jgi:hypothetical protein
VEGSWKGRGRVVELEAPRGVPRGPLRHQSWCCSSSSCGWVPSEQVEGRALQGPRGTKKACNPIKFHYRGKKKVLPAPRTGPKTISTCTSTSIYWAFNSTWNAELQSVAQYSFESKLCWELESRQSSSIFSDIRITHFANITQQVPPRRQLHTFPRADRFTLFPADTQLHTFSLAADSVCSREVRSIVNDLRISECIALPALL